MKLRAIALCIALSVADALLGQVVIFNNPELTMSFGSPCGEVIEVPAGLPWDDGTGGVPLFSSGRAGHVIDIVLAKRNENDSDGALVEGWSFGVGVEGPLLITDVSRKGTVSCDDWEGPGCVGCTGFYMLQLTGPPFGVGPQEPENHGAMALLALNLGCPAGHLPEEDGEWTIGKVRVTAEIPDAVGEIVHARVVLAQRSGAAGNGRPLPAGPSVRYGGDGITTTHGLPPLELEPCELTFKIVDPVDGFIRCDATHDGRLDITDAVRILETLFLGRPPSRCPAASDCNDDAATDVADAIYGLGFLFLGGPPPPAPWPECGKPAGLTREDCLGGTTPCP
jgi:hypothetical protein